MAHFANVASAGMSGAIAKRANETTKALGGKVSYLWATLAVFARWQNSEVRVSVGDEIQKKLRGLDELEKRVAKLERELAKKPATAARKRTTARKPAAAKKPST
jgi:uncharacterized small protein (DUF1192 family)